MEKNALRELLGKVLGIDPDTITDDMSPESVESWDSFNGLMIVTELEKYFNISFTVDEVINVKNVGDIERTLKARGLEF